MIYKIFILLFFVAELLISLYILRKIFKIDRKIIKINKDIENSKESITEIAVLTNKFSELAIEYAEDIKDRVEDIQENFLINNFSKIIKIILVIKINKIITKKFLSPKVYKNIKRSLKLLNVML